MVTVKESPVHGKGVFASVNILKGEVIVKSHMVLIHLNENLPEELANGIPNAEVIKKDFENQIQTFAAKTNINKGEEITIYYNDSFEEFVQTT